MADHLKYHSRHFIRRSIILLCIFLFLGPVSNSSPAEAKSVKAAAFSLKDLQGRTVKLDHFKGQVILLNFWATRCPPCRAEIPDFIATYKKYKEKGFSIIGISLDRVDTPADKKRLLKFVNNAGIIYPVLIGNRAVCNNYGGIYAIPTSFLIDSKGYINKEYIGFLKKDILEKDLLPLLKNKGTYKGK